MYLTLNGFFSQVQRAVLRLTRKGHIQIDMALTGFYLHNGMPLIHLVFMDMDKALALVDEGKTTKADVQRKRAEILDLPLDPITLTVETIPESSLVMNHENQEVRAPLEFNLVTTDTNVLVNVAVVLI